MDTELDAASPTRDIASSSPVLEPGQNTTLERDLADARTEDANTLARSRRMLGVGLALAPMYLLIDYVIATWAEPVPVWQPMALHLVQFLHIGAVLLAISRWTPTRDQLLTLERFTTVPTAAIGSLACVVAGGIDSVYALTIAIVLMARSAMRSDRIREACFSVLGSALAHPAVLLVAATLSPRIAAQLGDPQRLATFLVLVGFNLLVAMFVLTGGEAAWQLRRQLFEARLLGRYRLKSRLGIGGMGEVWAAYYPALKRDVAIKVLRADADSSQAVARFEREVRATAMLSHPNTIRVFDHGVTQDGLWYYAMELLEGQTLAELVLAEGPLEPARAARLIHQASRALAEAHGCGIIHRDLKPANLFVTTAGGEPDFVKVLDFGIARLREQDLSPSLTVTGQMTGTPAYFPPEVVAGEPADERGDVYGLGACLYFALAGRPPYPGADVATVLATIALGELAPPSAIVATIPAALESVTMTALARDPADRYADAGDLADALGAWLAERG
jgi:serine/threonine-protein kinase